MKYSCKKCKSEFTLEKDAADIYCPYCGYLAKSDDRNTFYNEIKVIKPIVTKKEFVISQLEKMARIDETPKDVFDNLGYNVKEEYLFYAIRKVKSSSTYEASVEFKSKETYSDIKETVSRDKDGNKVTTKEPYEAEKTVVKTKIISDFVKLEDSIVVNYKGANKKDLDLITSFRNNFEIDNNVEIPMSIIRSFLDYKKANEKGFEDKCNERVVEILNDKILEANESYEKCNNIVLKDKVVEFGDYDIYCVIKYSWEYKYNNKEYTLQELSWLKHIIGEYPNDTKINSLIEEKKEEIKDRYNKISDGLYAIIGVGIIIAGILIYFIAKSEDYTTNKKGELITILVVVFLAIFGILALINYILKRNSKSQQKKIEIQLKEEKQEKKNIMCKKHCQKIKDDEYKL